MVSLGKLRNPIIKKSTLVKAEKEAERKYRKDEPERERDTNIFFVQCGFLPADREQVCRLRLSAQVTPSTRC